MSVSGLAAPDPRARSGLEGSTTMNGSRLAAAPVNRWDRPCEPILDCHWCITRDRSRDRARCRGGGAGVALVARGEAVEELAATLRSEGANAHAIRADLTTPGIASRR